MQLPTFSYFSVATTVSVPDRGSALLGGVNRAYEGRSDFGVPLLGGLPHVGRGFHNASVGRQVGAGAIRLSTQVHDFGAMEQSLSAHSGVGARVAATRELAPVGGPLAAIMGTNVPASRTDAHPPTQPITSSPMSAGIVSSAARPAGSVAEARAQLQAEQAATAEEARRLFQRALTAESQGNIRAAKVYYQMAARRASGTLGEEISHRLAALAEVPSGPVGQQSSTATAR